MIASLVEKTAVRAGINPLEMKRFVKFGVVGVIGAVVDFGVLNVLRAIFFSLVAEGQITAVPYWGDVETTSLLLAVASGVSFTAAIISNFLWNRFWTYPDSRSKSFRRQFAQFFFVNFLGILIRVPIVGLTHVFFGEMLAGIFPAMSESMSTLLGDNLSVVLAVGIVMFWNFFVNRYWTYSDVDTDVPSATNTAV